MWALYNIKYLSGVLRLTLQSFWSLLYALCQSLLPSDNLLYTRCSLLAQIEPLKQKQANQDPKSSNDIACVSYQLNVSHPHPSCTHHHCGNLYKFWFFFFFLQEVLKQT